MFSLTDTEKKTTDIMATEQKECLPGFQLSSKQEDKLRAGSTQD